MLRLYHYPLSPCSEKIRYALSWKSVQWEEYILDLAEKENLSSEYLELNPSGCIPTLCNGSDVVVESTAILDYIEAAFPIPALTPSEPIQMAQMRQWTKWVDEVLHPAWPGIAWVVLVRPRWLQLGDDCVRQMVSRLPESARRERQLDLYHNGFSSNLSIKAFDVFRQTLKKMQTTFSQNPMLCGSNPTLADISLLPYLSIASAFGILDDEFGLPDSIRNWMKSLTNCRSLQTALIPQITEERSREIFLEGKMSLQKMGFSSQWILSGSDK